jgi:hypothetical protein
MQCTRAAKPGVFKWTITRRGPVIADVDEYGVGSRIAKSTPHPVFTPMYPTHTLTEQQP